MAFLQCLFRLLCILVNLHSILSTYIRYRGMLIINLYSKVCCKYLGTPSLGNGVGLVDENGLQVYEQVWFPRVALGCYPLMLLITCPDFYKLQGMMSDVSR